MINIWYSIIIKPNSTLVKVERFKNVPHLYVKINESLIDDDEVTFTVWNGHSDSTDDYERLTMYEAIDSLRSVRNEKGEHIFLQDEKLDLEWNKCIYPDKKYNNR